MDYDRYTSFPPIQPVSRVVSAFQRVNTVENTIETVRHTDYKGSVTSEVQIQTYNKSGELRNHTSQKNIIDQMI